MKRNNKHLLALLAGLLIPAASIRAGGGCPADCANGDGLVSTPDLLQLLGDWGGPSVCDIDLTGTVATADLLLLLSNWGPCPAPDFCGPGAGTCCAANRPDRKRQQAREQASAGARDSCSDEHPSEHESGFCATA